MEMSYGFLTIRSVTFTSMDTTSYYDIIEDSASNHEHGYQERPIDSTTINNERETILTLIIPLLYIFKSSQISKEKSLSSILVNIKG